MEDNKNHEKVVILEISHEEVRKKTAECEVLLLGIGNEWSQKACPEVIRAYELLYHLIKDKNYFIVTTVTDGVIWNSALDEQKITAPCGNENWRQCSESCTKDIWERGEVLGDICPHCGAPLTGNTIQAKEYIENGYLPQWERYKKWLTETLNKKLLVLELGVGFKTPTVIRWPFEKTVFFNQKSHMYRVNETFYQISAEIKERAAAVPENSVKFIEKLARM